MCYGIQRGKKELQDSYTLGATEVEELLEEATNIEESCQGVKGCSTSNDKSQDVGAWEELVRKTGGHMTEGKKIKGPDST